MQRKEDKTWSRENRREGAWIMSGHEKEGAQSKLRSAILLYFWFVYAFGFICIYAVQISIIIQMNPLIHAQCPDPD